MRFQLTIDCDNAAFAPVHDDASEADRVARTGQEVSRILSKLSRDLTDARTAWDRKGFVRDLNGNRCGSWSLREEDEPTCAPWVVDDCPDADGFWTIRRADGSVHGDIEAEPIATVYAEADADLIVTLANDAARLPREAFADEIRPPAEDQPERLYRVAYYRETAPRGWTLDPERYTLEEAGAEAKRRATRDNLAQVLRDA